MGKRITGSVIAAAAATMSLGAATPAAAESGYDCRILGPEYVQEVVDCAFYILEHLA